MANNLSLVGTLASDCVLKEDKHGRPYVSLFIAENLYLTKGKQRDLLYTAVYSKSDVETLVLALKKGVTVWVTGQLQDYMTINTRPVLVLKRVDTLEILGGYEATVDTLELVRIYESRLESVKKPAEFTASDCPEVTDQDTRKDS